MSIDYFIFVDSDDIDALLKVISTIEGVEMHEGRLLISGLLFTTFGEMDELSRTIMREDFGQHGLKVNWRICGTYDKSHDIDELLMRLFRCVASIIKSWPEKHASLMFNAESFYVLNNSDEVMISRALVHNDAGASLVKELSLVKKTTLFRVIKSCGAR